MAGPHERRLINDLMRSYKSLERPVANESEAVVLKFGLTLQQIMDVVSSWASHLVRVMVRGNKCLAKTETFLCYP